MTGDLSETRTAAKPNSSGVNPSKPGTPREKTKRKLVKVTGNVTQPWLNRLRPRNLKTK